MLFAYTVFGAILLVLQLVVNAGVRNTERKAYAALRERDLKASNELLKEAAERTMCSTVVLVALVLWVIGIFGLMLNQ